MNSIREAVQEYLVMRRGLGFKLHDAGVTLLDFVSYLENQGVSCITTKIALAWAQLPTSAQPAEWARRLSCVRCFAGTAVPLIPGPRFLLGACFHIGLAGPIPIYTQTRK